MIKVVALEFFAGGTLLLVFGIKESKSLSLDISRILIGSAADKAIWMLVGGTIGIALGMIGLFMHRREVKNIYSRVIVKDSN
jgi:hypothetical protein